MLTTPVLFFMFHKYFKNGKYCLFGSKTENNGCTGWVIDSFQEALTVFLIFLPILPLTLHLIIFASKMLMKTTLNFLSMDVSTDYSYAFGNDTQTIDNISNNDYTDLNK